jgi:hypothetical protein
MHIIWRDIYIDVSDLDSMQPSPGNYPTGSALCGWLRGLLMRNGQDVCLYVRLIPSIVVELSFLLKIFQPRFLR